MQIVLQRRAYKDVQIVLQRRAYKDVQIVLQRRAYKDLQKHSLSKNHIRKPNIPVVCFWRHLS